VAVRGLGTRTAAGAGVVLAFLCAAPAIASGASARGDFDGDGRGDLAVGALLEGVASGGNNRDGAVNVVYGTRKGLRTKGSQFLNQNTAGMAGDGAEAADNFGGSLAAGDFNGDGRDDLAVGVAEESLGSMGNREGAVNVIYGTRKGLRTKRSRLLTQNSPGMAGDGAEAGDEFGFSIASGDFNHDGRDDLAIGVPSESIGSGANSAGAVNVVYGSRRGLRTKRSRFFEQNSAGMAGDGAEMFDDFGWVVAAANLGRGRGADLAVGVPFEGVSSGGNNRDGAVNVLYSGRRGLRTKGSQFFNQNTPGMAGDGAETNDTFGLTLAAGDFGKGGRADLAVGVPEEGIVTDLNTQDGAVNILYTRRRGLRTKGSQFLSQDTPGMAGDGAEPGDGFAWSLAAGNLGKGRRADLAVGVPFEDVASGGNAEDGAVNVVYGARNGLRTAGSQFLNQDTPGMAGDGAEAQDEFGYSTSIGDYDGDGRPDMSVGVPHEGVEPGGDDGAVNALYGTKRGLKTVGSQFLDQDSPGMAGDGAESGDSFGCSLTASGGQCFD
jgi:hypothetical protein